MHQGSGAERVPQGGAWAARSFEDSGETRRSVQSATSGHSESATGEGVRPLLFPSIPAAGSASPSIQHVHTPCVASPAEDLYYSTSQGGALNRPSSRSRQALFPVPEATLDPSSGVVSPHPSPGGRPSRDSYLPFRVSRQSVASPASRHEESVFPAGTEASVSAAPPLSASFAWRVLAEQRRQRHSQLSLGQVYAHLYTPGASRSPSARLPPLPHSSLRPASLLSSTSGGSLASSRHGDERSQNTPHGRGRRSSPSPGLGWGAVRRSRWRLGPPSSASLPSLGSRPPTPSSGVSTVHGFWTTAGTPGDRDMSADGPAVAVPLSGTHRAAFSSLTPGPDTRFHPYRRGATPASSTGYRWSLSSTERAAVEFQPHPDAQLAQVASRIPASTSSSFSPVQAVGSSGVMLQSCPSTGFLSQDGPSSTIQADEGEAYEGGDRASGGPSGAGGEIWDGAPSALSSSVAASPVDIGEAAVQAPEENATDVGQGPMALASRWLRKLVQSARGEDTTWSGQQELQEDCGTSKYQLSFTSQTDNLPGFLPPNSSCSFPSSVVLPMSNSERGKADGEALAGITADRLCEGGEMKSRGTWLYRAPPANRLLALNEAGTSAYTPGYSGAEPDAWFAKAGAEGPAFPSDREGFLSAGKTTRSLVNPDYALDPWRGVFSDSQEALTASAESGRQNRNVAIEAAGPDDGLAPRWMDELVSAMTIQQRERLLSPAFFRPFTLEEVAQSLEELVRIYADDEDICSDAEESDGAGKGVSEARERANAGRVCLSASLYKSVHASSDASKASNAWGSPLSSVSSSGVPQAGSAVPTTVAAVESSQANSSALAQGSRTYDAEKNRDGDAAKASGDGEQRGSGDSAESDVSGDKNRCEATRRKSKDISQTERGGLLFAFNAGVLAHREKLESFVFLLNVLRHLKGVLSACRQPVSGPDSGRLTFAAVAARELSGSSGLSLGRLDFLADPAKTKHAEKTASQFWGEQAALSARALVEAQTHAGWTGVWPLLPQDARRALGRAVERARSLDAATQELARVYLHLQDGEWDWERPRRSRDSQRPDAVLADQRGCWAPNASLPKRVERKSAGAHVEREFIRVKRLGDGTELWRVVERTEAAPGDGRSLSSGEDAEEGRTGCSWSALLGYGVHPREELKGWQLAVQTLFQHPDDACGGVRRLVEDTGIAVTPSTLALLEEVEKELGGPVRSHLSMLSEDFLEILSSLFPGQTPRVECIDMLAAILNTMDFVSLGAAEYSSLGSSPATSNSFEAGELDKHPLKQPLVHCVDAIHVADGILDWRTPRMQTVVLQLVQDAGIHFQRLWNRMTAATAGNSLGEQAAEAHFLIPLYGPFTAYLIVFKLERLQGSKTPTTKPNSCSVRGDECRCTYQVLDCMAAATHMDAETQERRAGDVETLASLISTMLWTKGSLRFLKKAPDPGTLEEKVMMSVLPSPQSRTCVPSFNGVLPNGSSVQVLDETRFCDVSQDTQATIALLTDTGKFTLDCCGIILLFSIEAFYSGHRAGLLKPAAVPGLRFLYARRILEVFVLRKSLFHSCALPMFCAVERSCSARKPIMSLDAPSPPASVRQTLYLGAGV
ncbi:hypothetical protein TGP89_223760 [Toxoplasma gondii p89]|uniref:Uncharacterized protein n=1 Tax=Toxoplasma gondii p89 TaxID=943119 RepID=A0A086JGL7_TOXGO|nr:hypothetical protein TGP89_223760 [Toxoplasma gondii p89]